MYPPPIARNPALVRLADDGYAVEVHPDGVLVVHDVPYVDGVRTVKLGKIIVPLTLAGSIDDVVGFPDHTVYFKGDCPCDHAGRVLNEIIIDSTVSQLTPNWSYNHRFSSRPANGYLSMDAQIRQYATILESYAQRVNPVVTARPGPRAVEEPDFTETVFLYHDSASVRAGIVGTTEKLRSERVAIVGLGGTGAYVLDQVSKTPVQLIDLFDDDTLYTHNAFRAPGAITIDELRTRPLKVNYWSEQYGAMRRGIRPRAYRLSAKNAHELAGCQAVFLCMDSGPDKGAIIEFLQSNGITFFDCGLGVQKVGGSLRGIVRVTKSTASQHAHVGSRVSVAEPERANEYGRNIQVADLNALNAVLAVIAWKKHCGFYHDFVGEHDTTYTINTHLLTRDVRVAPNVQFSSDVNRGVNEAA